VAWQQTLRTEPSSITLIAFVPWVTFLIGFILTNVGKYHTLRYGGRPRVDQALAQALKGLDSRHHLFNFVPTIPAEHLLVTPNGLVLLETRPFFGEIIHKRDRWSRPFTLKGLWDRFSDGGIGNPTTESRQDSEAVHAVLTEQLGDDVAGSIVVTPIIVCTNPRLRLQQEDPEVPVVMIGDLRGAIRKLRDGTRLTSDVQRQIIRAFQWGTQAEPETLPTTRSKTWQRTQK
ncbi:MAG TPA: nuclease-related domain-containing protein, partial [Chloroflexota bacterium]|nr:nuclease-related domain-containing protein [Chloroflexota bacterium]